MCPSDGSGNEGVSSASNSPFPSPSLITQSKSELEADIQNTIDLTRAKLSLDNQQEFTAATIAANNNNNASSLSSSSNVVSSPYSSARINSVQLDRSKHMRTSVVDNTIQDHFYRIKPPPSSSTFNYSPHSHIPPSFSAEEERIVNIEKHLGIIHNNNSINNPPIDISLIQRIKIIEDKILRIEQHYPQVAMREFNYMEKAEWTASNFRPGGRVSGYHFYNSYNNNNNGGGLSLSEGGLTMGSLGFGINGPFGTGSPLSSRSPSSSSLAINKKKKKKISVNLRVNNSSSSSSKSQQVQEIRDKLQKLRNKLVNC